MPDVGERYCRRQALPTKQCRSCQGKNTVPDHPIKNVDAASHRSRVEIFGLLINGGSGQTLACRSRGPTALARSRVRRLSLAGLDYVVDILGNDSFVLVELGQDCQDLSRCDAGPVHDADHVGEISQITLAMARQICDLICGMVVSKDT